MMFILVMNDMRYANIETLSELCWASSVEEIDAFLASETVEGYRDERWGKSYRKGGPLEWKNQPYDTYVVRVPETINWHGIQYSNSVPNGLPSLELFRTMGAQ